MTVGTLTYHRTINYGGILQAYALQRVIADMGHASEIIDYWNPQNEIFAFSRLRLLQHRLWHGFVKRVLVGDGRARRTSSFCAARLSVSARRYSSAAELLAEPPQFDAYVVGSDQVWNPRIHNGDVSYFLGFVPEGRRTISYAASFGVAKLPDRFAESYADWLQQMQFLSTREVEGKEMIKQLTGRDAAVVLDPTLLLRQEQWAEVAVPPTFPRPYILCYYMPGDEVVNQGITRFAHRIKALTGWEVICIGQKEYMRLHPTRRSVFDAGPAEFLGLLQNASYVVTNSFHGAAFSVVFRKPFLVPWNRSLPPERALTSRITTLLNALGLESQLVPADTGAVGEEHLALDYARSGDRLEQEVGSSCMFLANALKEG